MKRTQNVFPGSLGDGQQRVQWPRLFGPERVDGSGDGSLRVSVFLVPISGCGRVRLRAFNGHFLGLVAVLKPGSGDECTGMIGRERFRL